MFHVIIAGGSGTRFWPWSTKSKPKQLLKIFEEQTMIRHTVDRIKEIESPKNIFIIANKYLLDKMKNEIPELPTENFILEPSAKNTAPAIGLCAIHLLKRDNNEVMAIYPSDHFISGQEFKETILSAEKFAKKQPGLITIGIKPTYPATGYGYININNEIDSKLNIYSVDRFVEKPNKQKAKLLLEKGDNFWNSGIFVWSINSIMESIKKHMPDLYSLLIEIYEYIGNENYYEKLNLFWDKILAESIDYGILEKEKNIYLIPGKFIWSDLGNWKSLYDLLIENNQDVVKGNVFSIDSSNNLIISPKRLTATIGLKNMIIINMNNTTLVMPIEESEKVKHIVSQLNNNKK